MAGYIGSAASVVSSGAENKKTFTITGATTSLTGLNYPVGKVHVFQNGVRLVDGTDYTATNGTTITLTVAAQSGDNVVVISQADFQVSGAVSTSGDTMTGDLTVQGAFTSVGIDDNADAVALTIDSSENVLIGKTSDDAGASIGVINRANGRVYATVSGGEPAILNRLSSDGDIIDFKKDGSTVGSIGVDDNVGVSSKTIYLSSSNSVGSIDVGLKFDWNNNQIVPCQSGGTERDNAIALGASGARFKDLYLSGGVYLGGTGSANKLEDYEEGTWTASFSGTTATNIGNTTGYYTKIGDTVHFTYYSGEVDLANAVSGGARITGLPFTSSNSTQRYGLFLTSYGNAIQNESNGGFVAKNGNHLVFMIQESNSETTWYNGTNKRIMVAGTYMVG
jgi:hypothetical protein